MRNNNIIIPEF